MVPKPPCAHISQAPTEPNPNRTPIPSCSYLNPTPNPTQLNPTPLK